MHPYILLYKTLLPKKYRNYLERAAGDLDMCHETLLHGTFYEEYKAYGFAGKSEAERRSYLTDAVRDKLCRRINSRGGEQIVANKWLTYSRLQKFYHRKVWLLQDSTMPQVLSHALAAGRLVVKPADSGVPFRGERIPQWDELTALCTNMAMAMPGMTYIGWDMALTTDGWEPVEANRGEFIAQQITLNRGLLHDFERACGIG